MQINMICTWAGPKMLDPPLSPCSQGPRPAHAATSAGRRSLEEGHFDGAAELAGCEGRTLRLLHVALPS